MIAFVAVVVVVLVAFAVAGYISVKGAPPACGRPDPDFTTSCELLAGHSGLHSDGERMWA